MRVSCLSFLGVCFLTAGAATCGLMPQPVYGEIDETASDVQYFAVEVQPMVAGFEETDIVSDPPIIEASFYQMDSAPHVAVSEGAEAYLLTPENRNNEFRGYRVIGARPRGTAVDGRIFMIQRHPEQQREAVLAKFAFKIEADAAANATREDFLRAKGQFAQRQWSEEMAGSAMFRHVAMKSLAEVGETARKVGPAWPLRPRDGTDETIRLMSGGRAVSENLQLDVQLETPEDDDGSLVALSEVEGITIREMNWDTLLKNEPTELDPLAKLIPHDQYAVFVPRFDVLTRIIDRGGELAKPMVQWFEPQSRKTDVLGFYQSQLGLPLNALTRQVGRALIGEIAVTGSDPYFRTGTDVAVLMASGTPELLHQSIRTQVMAEAGQHEDMQRTEHTLGAHKFTQWSTDDRRFCSYVGLVGDTVVVTNSSHQMKRILKCTDGGDQNMHDLKEYKFFRQRYQRDQSSTLVVITDAAIRRWCGPQWRISASRRTRARATIAEVTAQNADALVHETVEGTTAIHTDENMPDAGTLLLTKQGVVSERYGTLRFQTPIAEIDLRSATQDEVDVYNGWRTRYERRWRRVFDPIALQISLEEKKVAADLTVIPLIAQSQYQTYIQLVGEARLKPDAGIRHAESLMSVTTALDTRSPVLQMANAVFSRGQPSMNVLGWIDDSGSFYFERDDEWIKRRAEGNPWEMNDTDMLRELPLAFFIPSKDNFRMTAFVVAARAAIDQFAPNMIRWENLRHGKHEFVMGTAVASTPVGSADDMPSIYYVTTPKGLTISLNRHVIQRAIDRQMDASDDEEAIAEAVTEPDSGSRLAPQLELRTTGEGVSLLTRASYRNGLRRMNRIAWSNLPIMNYFRHRYPDRDPAKVYEKLFGETLAEPSGGEYVWNAERGTYVSSFQGYHLEPQAGPAVAPSLEPEDKIETTLSFQDGGIRATLGVSSQ